MDKGTLKALLDAEKVAALAAMQSSKLSAERDDALMYYMGDMSKDMPTQDGQSSAVSSDVADTIEGLLPQLMEIFAGTEETIRFNPVGPEDVESAQQETDYINHVLMQRNPGFLVLYSFIKDALLSKVGIVKVWWEENEETERETYYDLTDEQYAILTADKDVEIVKHTEHPDPMLSQALATQGGVPQQQGAAPPGPPPLLHDVEVVKSKKYAEAKVLGVPPEEFGIEKTARSIRTCNYCFHRNTQRTETDLIAEGYDAKIVKALPTYMAITNIEEINRDSVGEHLNVGDEHNPSARRLSIIEHYVRMDYEGDGKTRLYKVTTGDEQGVILTKNGELDIVEFDMIPFACMTPVIITHRFFGRSIADLVLDIQRIKTSLLRALLNNAYLANNPRVEVAEDYAGDNTLDDLLISRQGGIVRTRMPGGLNWQQVPTIGNHVYPLLEYQDNTREMRTGVSRQGQGLDPETLQSTTATAVQQMFSLAQARMKLVARIFAETGIKDLAVLLHGIIRKHGQEAQTVRLRNKWVTVDPRDWKKRNDMTVEVGLGTGGKAEQMAMVQMLIGAQEKAIAGGLTNLVTPQNLYSSAKLLTRIAGHKDVDQFFTDPSTQPPAQPQPDPKLQIEMMKAQSAAQLEQQKQQTEAVHEKAKLEANFMLEQQKFEHEKEMAYLEMGMKQKEHEQQLTLAAHKAHTDAQAADHKMQLAEKQHQTAKAGQTHASIEVKHGAEELTGPIADTLGKFADHLAKTHESHAKTLAHHTKAIGTAIEHMNKPKRILRDPKTSRAIGVETVQ